MRGLVVDWEDYDRVYSEAGLDPAQGPHAGRRGRGFVYDDDYHARAPATPTNFMYSPMPPTPYRRSPAPRALLALLGTRVVLEFTVDHHYEQVAAHAVARAAALQPRAKDGLT